MVAPNLEAWEVDERDFPAVGSMDEKLRFLLRYAVLAPSGPNTQPWKFSIRGEEISIIADMSRALPAVEPTNRTLFISLGCALANLLIAAEHFGLGYRMQYFPYGLESDRVATVSFRPDSEEKHFADLFHQITRRHTNRTRFETTPIPPENLQAMRDLVVHDGFILHIMTDYPEKEAMADLLGRSHKIQLGNKEFRRDLASWIRSNTSDAYDGLPGYSFGYSDFESYFGQFIFGAVDTSNSRARKETDLMKASPVVAVISSHSDDKISLIKLGVTFEAMFLLATQMDIRFDLFSQPIGIEALRQEMASILKVSHPQILIRMGYAQPVRHTPRRPVEMVLVPP